MIEFQPWPKTPRLSAGDVVITEKIDGTNACVVIDPEPLLGDWEAGTDLGCGVIVDVHGTSHVMYAQSRKRFVHPDTDNAGFARWVWDNSATLAELLGVGHHFGEWWGQGIQRRYGMPTKIFSLFDSHRWNKVALDYGEWGTKADAINLDIVPVLHIGKFSDRDIERTLELLRQEGSFASLKYGVRFNKPEGVIVRHQSLGGNLKVLLENDDIPKSLVKGDGRTLGTVDLEHPSVSL